MTVIKDDESYLMENSSYQEVFGQQGVITWCLTRC